MNGFRRFAAAARRGAVALVPAGRRDWVEAVWTEAAEVAPGLPRLRWRVGALRLVAREASGARRVAAWTLVSVAAGWMIWSAWWAAPSDRATSLYRVDVITIAVLLVLAGAVVLAGWGLDARHDSRTARALRLGTCAAILALTAARHVLAQVLDTRPSGGVDLRLYLLIDGPPPGHPIRGGSLGGEILFLVVVAVYAAAVFWVTSRRSRVAPATLAIGSATGFALGLVLYTVGPLGLSSVGTDPWLPGSDVVPLAVLAWILLFCGPLAAGVLADRRFIAASRTAPTGLARARAGQIIAVGLLANLMGALFYSVAALGTTAVMVKAAWLRTWLYHRPRQLFGVGLLRQVLRGDPAAVAYSHQLTGATDGQPALAVLIIFALIALGLNGFIGLCLWAEASPERDDPRRGDGGGQEDQEPPSDSPPGVDLPEEAADDVGAAAGRLDGYVHGPGMDPIPLGAGAGEPALQPVGTP